jgi:hypothetical protein
LVDVDAALRQVTASDGLDLVFAKVQSLEAKYAERDGNAQSLKLVRRGKWGALSPESFSESFPAPIVANLIDNFCRDFGSTVAPLPSFNCSTGLLTEKAKKAAAKRTRIVNHYLEVSNLESQMLEGGDSYAAYGLLGFEVQPDLQGRFPRIRVMDGSKLYPLWDRNMRTSSCAYIDRVDKATLAAQYPDAGQVIREAGAQATLGNSIKVVKYDDGKNVVTYLPECGNHVLERYKNVVGRCSFVAVPRPSSGDAFNGDVRGAYDDLIWPQIARHMLQVLAIEGAWKAVESPLVVPTDVTDVPMGPDAVIHTNNPQGVQKVRFDLPVAAFQTMEQLASEMRHGAASPEARSGSISASVVTGKGVEQLMESYSTQIAAAQSMFKYAFKQVIELCFLWDEKVWPNLKRTVRGTEQGAPYQITYVSSEDINGHYDVDVQYGFLAGLDANRALVYVLQARGDGLVSREFARRQLPANINVVEEERRVQLEQMDDAMLAALNSLAQEGLAQLAGTGQDPTSIVQKIAEARKRLKKGDSLDEVVSSVFAPPPPPEPQAPGAEQLAAPGEPQAGGGAGVPPGAGGDTEVALNGGGRPSLQQLFAGLSGAGNPQLSAGVARMLPTG